jgi:hypothetical protein
MTKMSKSERSDLMSGSSGLESEVSALKVNIGPRKLTSSLESEVSGRRFKPNLGHRNQPLGLRERLRLSEPRVFAERIEPFKSELARELSASV